MPPHPCAIGASAPHIVVVDDEPQIRDILAAVLQREGYRVTSRGDPRDALRDVQEGGVELIVTDLKMPEMNGLDLIRAAKQAAPGLGSVLITAYASMETAVSALRSGADDYLMKPFGIDDLRRVVERVLADRRVASQDREALDLAREENESLRRERRDAEEALFRARDELRLSRRDLERRVRDLEFVTEVANLLAGEDLERIVGTAARVTGRRLGALVTRIEADAGAGVIEAEHREGEVPVALPLPMAALLLDRARRDAQGAVRDEVLGQGRPLEAMAAGLVAAGRPAGGIVLLRPLASARDGDDLALLRMLAHALKPALESEGHRRRAEANALEIAHGILAALEGRQGARRGHAQRVAALVGRAAERLGLPPRDRRAVETAARLHDLGEVGVPEELLSRAGPLSPEEMAVVRAHAAVGAQFLQPLGEVARLVRHHHERSDGAGYPDGLAEDDIPVGSALIGVAEAYDAMTHGRPYRVQATPTEARREIFRLRGVQFVPCAVDAVMEVIPA